MELFTEKRTDQDVEMKETLHHAITDSFNRNVIHGDAESRGKWFTYAVVSVLGFKGVSKVGKAGTEAAKKGAQKTGQMLDVNLNDVDRKSPDAHIPYKK